MSYSLLTPKDHTGLQFQQQLTDIFTQLTFSRFNIIDVCRVWKTRSQVFGWKVGVNVPATYSLYTDGKKLEALNKLIKNAKISKIEYQANEYDQWYVTFAIVFKAERHLSARRQVPPSTMLNKDDQERQAPNITNKYEVLVKRKIDHSISVIPIEVFDENIHYPRHLLMNGMRVTRRFTGCRSLSTRLLTSIRDKINKGIEYVRSFVKSELGKKKKTTSQQQPARQQFISGGIYKSAEPSKPTYNCVPFDYSKNIDYRKFTPSVLTAVRTYLIRYLGVPGYHTVRPMNSRTCEIPLRAEITAAGLPLDESLFTIYREYCQNLGFTGDVGEELCKWAKMN